MNDFLNKFKFLANLKSDCIYFGQNIIFLESYQIILNFPFFSKKYKSKYNYRKRNFYHLIIQ